MYDKSKARIFRSMGIHTISITDLGVERILDYFDSNRLQVVKKIGEDSEIKIIKIKASLSLMMPLKDTKIKDNDTIYFSVLEESLLKFKEILY